VDELKAVRVKIAEGSGPRHITFSSNGKFVYLIQELSGTVSAFRFSKGNMQLIQSISSYPSNYLGELGSADIHLSPDGKFLYASNRGNSNTIAIF
jgi:6-phosphogluconolactonase